MLRSVVVEAVKKEVIEYLLTIMALDKLTENSGLTEEDVLETSKAIKESIRRK